MHFSQTTQSDPVTVTFTIYPEQTNFITDTFGSSAVLWLDATTIDSQDPTQVDSADQSKVIQWNDNSQFSKHATNSDSATRPILVENAINGMPGIDFGANTTFLEVGDVDSTAGEVTAFIVSQSSYETGDDFQRMLSAFTGTGNNWEAPNYFISHPYLEELSYDYSPEITRQPNDDRSLINVIVGAQDGGINGYSGTIGEIILFDRALNNNETAQVEAYLADKWGLWNTLPGNHSQRTPDGYTAWLWNYPTIDNTGPDADPNGNGLSNYLDYVLGNDPTGQFDSGKITSINTGTELYLLIRTLSDYEARGLEIDIEYAYDLKNPTWLTSGDGDNPSFEIIFKQASPIPGYVDLYLQPDGELSFPLFVRIKRTTD